MSARTIFITGVAGRNLFDPVTMAALGFRYRGVGRGYAGAEAAPSSPAMAAWPLPYLERGDSLSGGKRNHAR